MKNIIILFNPYYQTDVIQQHLKVLIENEKVAFGKVRSKLKTIEHNFEEELNNFYKKINCSNHLQLFLTDYSNLFVAKVEEVIDHKIGKITPSYYEEKKLEVEKWFIISDMRELVRNNFQSIRDNYLSNFLTPNFGNHTYAIYGNNYIYPLIVNMKQEINYFETPIESNKYYPNIYKSDDFLQIKESLIKFSFGTKYINYMHPNTIDNVISAEIEYQSNISNPLYDFSSVVIKYSKTLEQEIYLFIKSFFTFLIKKEKNIRDIEYSVQGHEYKLKDIFDNKPNLGTYKFLLKNELILKNINSYCENHIKFYISKSLPYYINMIQNIRNETIHGTAPQIEEVNKLRNMIIGVECESIVLGLTKQRSIF